MSDDTTQVPPATLEIVRVGVSLTMADGSFLNLTLFQARQLASSLSNFLGYDLADEDGNPPQ